MNKKAQVSPGVIILLVTIVVIISVVVILFLPLGSGYKVTVYGSATQESVSYERVERGTRDLYFLFQSGQPLWFLDSDQMVIEATLDGQTVSKSIGTFNVVWPSPKDFSLTFRHINIGDNKQLVFNLYKVSGWFSSLGFGEKTLVDTTGVLIDVQ